MEKGDTDGSGCEDMSAAKEITGEASKENAATNKLRHIREYNEIIVSF
ncbi:MAG TPA: hypothetical protein VIE17_10260 [Methylophilaceae bacterium]